MCTFHFVYSKFKLPVAVAVWVYNDQKQAEDEKEHNRLNLHLGSENEQKKNPWETKRNRGKRTETMPELSWRRVYWCSSSELQRRSISGTLRRRVWNPPPQWTVPAEQRRSKLWETEQQKPLITSRGMFWSVVLIEKHVCLYVLGVVVLEQRRKEKKRFTELLNTWFEWFEFSARPYKTERTILLRNKNPHEFLNPTPHFLQEKLLSFVNGGPRWLGSEEEMGIRRWMKWTRQTWPESFSNVLLFHLQELVPLWYSCLQYTFLFPFYLKAPQISFFSRPYTHFPINQLIPLKFCLLW